MAHRGARGSVSVEYVLLVTFLGLVTLSFTGLPQAFGDLLVHAGSNMQVGDAGGGGAHGLEPVLPAGGEPVARNEPPPLPPASPGGDPWSGGGASGGGSSGNGKSEGGCNQGIGNGAEGCDPGNSNHGDPSNSNDEGTGGRGNGNGNGNGNGGAGTTTSGGSGTSAGGSGGNGNGNGNGKKK